METTTKQQLRDAKEDAQGKMEKCVLALRESKKHATVNAYFFLGTFALSFFYPIFTDHFNTLFYLTSWGLTISLSCLRIKLFTSIIKLEMEYATAKTIETVAENELEKIRQIEYDEIRRKAGITSDSSSL